MAALRTWADEAGGVGLLVISLVDSAGLPLPNATDALVIYLTLQQPTLWWWYVAAATGGAVLGSLPLFWIGRRGGQALLERRFNSERLATAVKWTRRSAFGAILVPASMPPPLPFKIFAVLAGATGLPVWQFVLALTLGRTCATASKHSWRRPTATRPAGSSTSGRRSSRWRWPAWCSRRRDGLAAATRGGSTIIGRMPLDAAADPVDVWTVVPDDVPAADRAGWRRCSPLTKPPGAPGSCGPAIARRSSWRARWSAASSHVRPGGPRAVAIRHQRPPVPVHRSRTGWRTAALLQPLPHRRPGRPGRPPRSPRRRGRRTDLAPVLDDLPERLFAPDEVTDLRSAAGRRTGARILRLLDAEGGLHQGPRFRLALPLDIRVHAARPRARPASASSRRYETIRCHWQFLQGWPTPKHRLGLAVLRDGNDLPVRLHALRADAARAVTRLGASATCTSAST